MWVILVKCQNQHHNCYLRSFYVQVSVSTVTTNITIGKSDKSVKQFTPQPQWTYCAIPWDIGVRISEEGGEAIVLCTSRVFQKGNPTILGNRVSASRLGRARFYRSSKQPQPEQRWMELPAGLPSSNTDHRRQTTSTVYWGSLHKKVLSSLDSKLA